MDSVDKVGTLVGGRYRLLELAGQGGMAEVWRAELLGAAGFRRTVAIKRVLPHLVDAGGFREMFVEEARVGALLDHPNVVQVFDFGEDDGGLYLAMEWVEGATLRELAERNADARRRTDPPLAAAIGVEFLRALDAAHSHRVPSATGGAGRYAPIVHRDVTPSNVLLGRRGVVKLADFGLARAYDRTRMTPEGIVKGKIAYLAPETLRGAEASSSTDVYAAGVVLWELVAGERLHAGRSDGEIVRRLLDRKPHPLLRSVRADVQDAIADAIDRAIAMEPSDRHASAGDFARALCDALRTVSGARTDAAAIAREVAFVRPLVERSGVHGVDAAGAPAESNEAAGPRCASGGPLDGTGGASG